jgi:MYXO-CTERM domain-containing protein
LALTVDGSAGASIQSPPEEACAKKAAGDACSLPSGESGACKADKCNQLDYSKGSPPQSIEVDCIVCVAGAQPPPGPGPVAVGGDGGGGGDGGDEAGPGATGETAPTTTASDGPTVTAQAADASPEPPSSETRCSVTPVGDGPGWGISFLALALVAARRRPRSR